MLTKNVWNLEGANAETAEAEERYNELAGTVFVRLRTLKPSLETRMLQGRDGRRVSLGGVVGIEVVGASGEEVLEEVILLRFAGADAKADTGSVDQRREIEAWSLPVQVRWCKCRPLHSVLP